MNSADNLPQWRRRRVGDDLNSVDNATVLVEQQYVGGEARYWGGGYGLKGSQSDDLSCGWSEIRMAVTNMVKLRGRRVLHVGCAHSRLGLEMAADGLRVVDTDHSLEAIRSASKNHRGRRCRAADAIGTTKFWQGSFDLVVDKGMLDALACDSDKSLGRFMVTECCRVGRAFVCVSFGQPEMRLAYFQGYAVRYQTLDIKKRAGTTPVYVYVVLSKHYIWWQRAIALVLVFAWSLWCFSGARQGVILGDAAASLEPIAGSAQCNYEMVRDWTSVAGGLNWSLGAGTLLGAMRTRPPGLLKWEHDVDIYIMASDAVILLAKLRGRRGVLDFRGFVDRDGQPCCGFGFKIFHAYSTACELDVLVLAASTYAPWIHAKSALWPPWALPAASLLNVRYSHRLNDEFLVIPEDIVRHRLMEEPERSWDLARNRWRGGASLSYFHQEYFRQMEFFPLQSVPFYDVVVNIPKDPWASLNRTYGSDCAYVARIDALGGARVDLREPRYAHLLEPAPVDTAR